jgi:GTP-binding protein
MEQYFGAELIDLGVMIVDARHKPTGDDCTMAEWFKETRCPLIIVANKVDKVNKSQIEPNMARIRETFLLPEETPIIPFSAEKGTGRDLLVEKLQAVADKAKVDATEQNPPEN